VNDSWRCCKGSGRAVGAYNNDMSGKELPWLKLVEGVACIYCFIHCSGGLSISMMGPHVVDSATLIGGCWV
jgi:hypothetical protein